MIQQNKQQKSPTRQIGISVILALFMLGGMGYFSSLNAAKVRNTEDDDSAPTASASAKPDIAAAKAQAGIAPDMDYSTHPKEAMIRMRRCARESGGDFSRLSQNDQFMFDSVTGGAGKQWLKELSQHPEKYSTY